MFFASLFQSRGMQSTIYVEMAPGVKTEDLYHQLKLSYQVYFFLSLLFTSLWWRVWLFLPYFFMLFVFRWFQDEEFVVLLENGVIPRTHSVKGSNYCLINVFPDRIPGRAIIISVVCYRGSILCLDWYVGLLEF